MTTKTASIISAIIGISMTIFGFMTSDKEKYPVASKFSGVMIIAGVALATLGIFTMYPKASPITLIVN